jgi:hypothetical protein
MSEWQRIGEVPVDSGRLVLVDPMNTDDVAEHEGDSALSYELVSNDLGIAVALTFSTGLGDGTYPVWARFEEAGRRRSDRRGPGPVPASSGDRLRAALMAPRRCIGGFGPCSGYAIPARPVAGRTPAPTGIVERRRRGTTRAASTGATGPRSSKATRCATGAARGRPPRRSRQARRRPRAREPGARVLALQPSPRRIPRRPGGQGES